MNRHTHLISTGRITPHHVVQKEIDSFPRCRLVGIWRSPLVRAVRERGPGRAPAEQWHAFIAKNYEHFGFEAP